MRKVLTWWAQRPLQHESTYGIRAYRHNAVLLNHRDVEVSHVVSAVLNVNQTLEEGWPLYMQTGADDEYAEVYLQPGYMALYEGARLRHGRPIRFRGDEFAMVFTHNRPMDFFARHRYEHDEL